MARTLIKLNFPKDSASFLLRAALAQPPFNATWPRALPFLMAKWPRLAALHFPTVPGV